MPPGGLVVTWCVSVTSCVPCLCTPCLRNTWKSCHTHFADKETKPGKWQTDQDFPSAPSTRIDGFSFWAFFSNLFPLVFSLP